MDYTAITLKDQGRDIGLNQKNTPENPPPQRIRLKEADFILSLRAAAKGLSSRIAAPD